MGPPVESGCRHPIVSGRFQSILNSRPFENTVVAVGNPVAIRQFGSIA